MSAQGHYTLHSTTPVGTVLGVARYSRRRLVAQGGVIGGAQEYLGLAQRLWGGNGHRLPFGRANLVEDDAAAFTRRD